jgi:branched-chain amino acid transport system substrate-binding protein
MKNTIAGVAAMSLATIAAGASWADTASCPSPIPLGLTTALTGNTALLGTQARSGVEFAVDEINAAVGIDGKKLALTTEDTGARRTAFRWVHHCGKSSGRAVRNPAIRSSAQP